DSAPARPQSFPHAVRTQRPDGTPDGQRRRSDQRVVFVGRPFSFGVIGERRNTREKIEDRRLKIEDRLACYDAILDPRPSTLDPRASTLDPHPHVAAFSIGFIRSSSQNKKTELVTGGLTYGSSPLHQNVASNYDRRDARLIIAGSLGRASAEDEDHARPVL